MSTGTATHPSAPQQSTTPGRRFHWLVRLALPMIGMYLMMAPAIVAAVVVERINLDYTTPLGFLVMELPSLTVPLGAIGLVWLFMRYVDRRPLREAGLSFNARSIPLLLIGTAAMTAVSFAATYAVVAFGPPYEPTVSPWPNAWMAVGDLLIRSLIHASFCEELLFRGYLMQTLPFRNPWLVTGISAAAFGVLHLGSQGNDANAALYALNAAGFAFLAAALALAFRSIWPAVGVHFGWYIADDLTNRIGWGSGPAVWLVCALLAIVVGAVVIALHSRRSPSVPDPLFVPEADRR